MRKTRILNNATYTREQKIVAAVWYHEKPYTGLTWDQISYNFLLRFKSKLPTSNTVKLWERQLFENYQSNKASITEKAMFHRLAYIPYVKESFKKYPDLSCKARADMVGIRSETLNCILKHDFSPEDLEEIRKYSTKGIPNKNESNSEECSVEKGIDSLERNRVIDKENDKIKDKGLLKFIE